MKDVLRGLSYIIPAFLLVGVVQAQGLGRGSHKVTISRSPDTRVLLPTRTAATLAAIDPMETVQVKSNIPRLKLVLSVVEPREAGTPVDYLSGPPEQFRTLFSSESMIQDGPVERIPVSRLVSEIPDEIAYEEKEGRVIVVTVTE